MLWEQVPKEPGKRLGILTTAEGWLLEKHISSSEEDEKLGRYRYMWSKTGPYPKEAHENWQRG
jgi:hypothetical protein